MQTTKRIDFSNQKHFPVPAPLPPALAPNVTEYTREDTVCKAANTNPEQLVSELLVKKNHHHPCISVVKVRESLFVE